MEAPGNVAAARQAASPITDSEGVAQGKKVEGGAAGQAKNKKLLLYGGIAGGVVAALLVVGLIFYKMRSASAGKKKSSANQGADPKASGNQAAQQCQGNACAVKPDCKGIDCAAPSEQCVTSPCFNGLKPSQGAVWVRLPDNRVIFSYPFRHSRLVLSDGKHLAADDNGLRVLGGSGHEVEFWSFDGRLLSNDHHPDQMLRRVTDYEVALVPKGGSNNQSKQDHWLFDGQRFYSLDKMEQGKFLYVAYDVATNSLTLKEGTLSDLYAIRQQAVTVEGYVPEYS